MKPFESQIRLQKWQVDEVQRRVAELLRLEEQLRLDRSRLDTELVSEQRTAAGSYEASLTYGAFAERLIERRERLDRSIVEVEERIDQAREALRDAFAELKKFELAAQAAEARVRRLRDRRDQQTQDEIGLGMFRRQAE
jgi:flagellar export protein FliJ